MSGKNWLKLVTCVGLMAASTALAVVAPSRALLLGSSTFALAIAGKQITSDINNIVAAVVTTGRFIVVVNVVLLPAGNRSPARATSTAHAAQTKDANCKW